MKERQLEILRIITENEKATVAELSKLLNVSQVTIRKDLDTIEKNGLIKREHGYASLNNSDDLNIRLAQNFSTKEKIASRAAEDVNNGETVIIESGSSCALLAKKLAETKKDITIITNSAFIADFIRNYPNVKIVLLGGEYQKESRVLVGPLLRQSASEFFVDKIFIGVDGYTDENGFTGNDYLRAEAVRDLVKRAREVNVVSDSSKFGRISTTRLLGIDEISKVYTDHDLSEHLKTSLENQVDLVLV